MKKATHRDYWERLPYDLNLKSIRVLFVSPEILALDGFLHIVDWNYRPIDQGLESWYNSYSKAPNKDNLLCVCAFWCYGMLWVIFQIAPGSTHVRLNSCDLGLTSL